MARAKSPKRKTPRRAPRARKRKAPLAAPRKGAAKTAPVSPYEGLFTPSIELSDLAKSMPRLDLSALSSLGHDLGLVAGATQPGKSASTQKFALHEAKAIASVETLGALVRAFREERELTQQSFAERAGVGRRFLSELENGKPSLEFDKVLAVARAASIELIALPKRSAEQ